MTVRRWLAVVALALALIGAWWLWRTSDDEPSAAAPVSDTGGAPPPVAPQPHDGDPAKGGSPSPTGRTDVPSDARAPVQESEAPAAAALEARDVGARFASTEGLEPAAIQRVMVEVVREVVRCYHALPRSEATDLELLQIAFTIEADGSGRLDDTGASSAPALDGCVRDAFRERTFPPTDGRDVRVRYPIAFPHAHE